METLVFLITDPDAIPFYRKLKYNNSTFAP